MNASTLREALRETIYTTPIDGSWEATAAHAADAVLSRLSEWIEEHEEELVEAGALAIRTYGDGDPLDGKEDWERGYGAVTLAAFRARLLLGDAK